MQYFLNVSIWVNIYNTSHIYPWLQSTLLRKEKENLGRKSNVNSDYSGVVSSFPRLPSTFQIFINEYIKY